MIGTGELLVILGVVLVLFGGKKLPEFAKNLGLGIREFKKACNDTVDEKANNTTSCCGGNKKQCCNEIQEVPHQEKE